MKKFLLIYFLSSQLLFHVIISENCVIQKKESEQAELKIISEAISYIYYFFCDFISKNDNIQWFKTLLELVGNIADVTAPTSDMPEINQQRWWGNDDERHIREDTSIRPFRVQFKDEMIKDLRHRILNRRNLTKSLHGAVHTYGINTDLVDDLLDCWAHQHCYDFKEREDLLNQFPQFLTKIQGLDIHFIHIKPVFQKTVPIILLHGWPYSAFEQTHVIRHLMEKNEDLEFAFEIVVPSIPGYAYSEATNKIGLAPYQVGVIFNNLMSRLGHQHYYLHCGDVGQWIGEAMAVMYPERVLGMHSNFAHSLLPKTLVKYLLGQVYPRALVSQEYENRMYPVSRYLKFVFVSLGYFHVHSTRPDMLKGLEDSPAGLLSWIVHNNMVEALDDQAFLRPEGNLPSFMDVRDILDSLTVYWDSQCIVTASRLYAEYEAILRDPLSLKVVSKVRTPIQVPVAVIKFRFELYQSDILLKDKFPNLIQSTTLDYGGHFIALQQPEDLAESIRKSVKTMEILRATNAL